MAIAFCAPEEYDYLTNIEKTIGVQIPVSKGDPGWDRQPIRIEDETKNGSKTGLKKFESRRLSVCVYEHYLNIQGGGVTDCNGYESFCEGGFFRPKP